MRFLRSVLVVALWGCVAVFGFCGGLGFAGSLAALDSLWNGQPDDWFRITLFAVVWLGIAWGAYKWIQVLKRP